MSGRAIAVRNCAVRLRSNLEARRAPAGVPSQYKENTMDPQAEVLELYHHLLAAWNYRDAAGMATLFAEDGNIVGFDGSMLDGPGDIQETLADTFARHPTPPFISKVRHVRMLSDGIAVVSALAGMIPSGKTEIDPALNAVQSLVAVRQGDAWRVALFQNTPAAFHGQPDLVENMTAELARAAGGNPAQSLVDG
jgi:uncharacterized protein (TIGR02246 family)